MNSLKFVDEPRAVTHTLVWSLALPMIISGISVPMVAMADTFVAGRAPHAQYLAAVGMAAILLDYIFYGFGFLRMGATALAAQSYGRNDWQSLAELLLRATLIGAVLGILVFVAHKPIINQVFNLMSLDEELEQLSKLYFSIHIIGAPGLFVLLVQIGWLLGVARAWSTFFLVSLVNVVNIGLNFYLGLYLGWGIEGVAWAAVVAEYLGAIAGGIWCVYVCKKQNVQRFSYRKTLQNFNAYTQLFKINSDIFVRTIMLCACFTVFTWQSAVQSSEILAANALLLNFIMLAAFGMDGIAQAAEALVGRYFGAQQPQSLRRAVWLTCLWSLLIALVFFGVYLSLGKLVINTLTTIETVRQLAYQYLPWLIFVPLVSVWSYWVEGVFIGAAWTAEMRNMMFLSMLGFFVAVYYLSFMGNHGLWLSLYVLFVLRGALLLYWLPKKITLLTAN